MLSAGIAWAANQDTASEEQVRRTPLKVAEGVEYGNSFASHPHTAELLRKLGAKQIPCPGLCSNIIPAEALPPEEPVK